MGMGGDRWRGEPEERRGEEGNGGMGRREEAKGKVLSEKSEVGL